MRELAEQSVTVGTCVLVRNHARRQARNAIGPWKIRGKTSGPTGKDRSKPLLDLRLRLDPGFCNGMHGIQTVHQEMCRIEKNGTATNKVKRTYSGPTTN